MTNRQRLDATIGLWQKAWRDGCSVPSCPLCYDISCGECLLNQLEPEMKCTDFVKRTLGLGSTDREETLRHLLQLRLYLYGEVKRWVR